MNFKTKENQRTSHRGPRGAIYTVCFVGFVIPCVLALGDTILQAALCFYTQERIDYVANEVIDHFESVSELEENKFDYLFQSLAAANGMRLQSVKSQITPCTDCNEEAIQIKVSGRFVNDLGLFTGLRPFVKSYTVKLSKFETLGYVAVNGYPYCEVDTSRGLSAYMPIYRPSAASPTWSFTQDNAIGSVRKSVCDIGTPDDRKPTNWKQLAEGLLSIY